MMKKKKKPPPVGLLQPPWSEPVRRRGGVRSLRSGVAAEEGKRGRKRCFGQQQGLYGGVARFTSDGSQVGDLHHQSRLREAAVATFCNLKSLIKIDTEKVLVPGGAIHPLTRYVMNYVKYACEYKNTLEQVVKDYQRTGRPSSYDDDRDDELPGSTSNNDNQSNDSIADDPKPFVAQLMVVMQLLHSNFEAKSKLYKDQALCNIFSMNNGRYVMKKIKELLSDAWCWKRSLELRQYHKNYQRETWSKVLMCLKDEGLNVRGNVSKPVLKEQFKSFNAMIDEIHKMQSS
ncbi:hypothetical protein COCNU_06G020560 [Cocos nucifera]|uniref:Exocyst subunit Exo70 family protein n=1 Tax=Cocos nucifera TaxID=13894 RepID=A0A8K0IE72_COCNU|nr:hypothetical protein COCNU_06G020560 [Cocos nucifera]